MPELPEVELARRSLDRWLGDATLVGVHVIDPRILDPGQTAKHVSRGLEARRVQAIARRGKWLRLELDRGLCFSHLGMTGRWLLLEEGRAMPGAASLELHAHRDGATRRIVYADPRRFGRFVLAEQDLPAWTGLGPDPLLEGIDPRALHTALARRSSPIKVALLDQSLLAGIGNIQATEGLFFARLDPRRASSSLSRVEVGRLAKGLLRSIHATLASQPAEADEVLVYLSEGGDNPFAVYGREGTPCPRCRDTLQKVVLAGRGTVFCAKCQGGGGS